MRLIRAAAAVTAVFLVTAVFMSAPTSCKTLNTSAWPFMLAAIAGVAPLLFAVFTLAPSSRKTRSNSA